MASVRVTLDGPSMEAAIRAIAVYSASIPRDIIARRRASELLLRRLLRSRLRLVRAEMLGRRFGFLKDEDRLHYRAKKKSGIFSQIYLSPEELTYLKDGLETLVRRLQGGSAIERKLLFRCTIASQAIQAGKKVHSELVRALNVRRKANDGQRSTVPDRNAGPAVVDSAITRMRFREWTVRAGVFATISYMRYKTADMFWDRAYRLLERMIKLQKNVIVSQVRHGKLGYRLRDGLEVVRGIGVEPNKKSYVTPGFNIEELWVLREGLELRDGETGLNPTERVLLLKARMLEGARYGAGRRQLAWRLGGLAKRKRYGPRVRW
jgi:hypothetical protein